MAETRSAENPSDLAWTRRGVSGAIADLLPDHDVDDWEGAMRRLGAERDRYRAALEIAQQATHRSGRHKGWGGITAESFMECRMDSCREIAKLLSGNGRDLIR